LAIWTRRAGNAQLSHGIFFYFLMELLQGLQYFWIDQCDSAINKALTVIGFMHICLQPYFTHYMGASFVHRPRLLIYVTVCVCLLSSPWCSLKDQYKSIIRISLIGGVVLFGRLLFSYWSYDEVRQFAR
jgi:hypothetical protein